ncbi:MAG: hypothetical protein EXR72_14215 [Myxococcales bacterium]|nr:hypothetical protein [Myxococcales bacterium]
MRQRPVTGNMVGHGLRMRVRGMRERLEPALSKIADAALRTLLRQDLLQLARRAKALADQLA